MSTVDDAFKRPTDQAKDRYGYEYDWTSDAWKTMCMDLPCFEALSWPGYATRVLETKLSGEPIVIQLWKGSCQQFLGRKDFPGGIGGEVGIYRRIDGRKMPNLSGLPAHMRAVYSVGSALARGKLWWPAPELTAEIEMTLLNPETRKVLLRAPKTKTYWLNRWMQYDSYERFEKRNKVPASPTGYRMVFTIDGKTREW